MAQLSVQFLISAQVMISQFVRLSPTSGSVLSAWNSFSLPLPHSLMCTLSLSLVLSLSLSQNK